MHFLQNVNFEAIEGKTKIDLVGSPTLSAIKVIDNFRLLDVSLSSKIEIFHKSKVTILGKLGMGRGNILNVYNFSRTRRFEGILPYYNFNEFGLQIKLRQKDKLYFLIDIDRSSSSFYTLEYGSNFSNQFSFGVLWKHS